MKPNGVALLGALLAVAGMLGSWSNASSVNELDAAAWAHVSLWIFISLCLLASFIGRAWAHVSLLALGLAESLLALLAYKSILAAGLGGPAGWGFWCAFVGGLTVTVGALIQLSALHGTDRPTRLLRDVLPPATVPCLLFLTWEAVTEGLRIPMAFFPRVSDVYHVLISSYDVLIADSARTVFRQVLSGYAIGVSAGVLVGLVVAFSLFLRRGFLPLATAFSAIPIVGLAPVLGRAFGVDWESKAAVAVIVSFFPVVINVVQGLITIDPLKLDLMRSYAAGRGHVLFKLRLPNALPYLFNALKIASIIVLISVIVSEFLIPGPPQGLGQRISLSARSGRYDVTFAAITFASAIGIAFYNAIALLERFFTSWHSSFRQR